MSLSTSIIANIVRLNGILLIKRGFLLYALYHVNTKPTEESSGKIVEKHLDLS